MEARLFSLDAIASSNVVPSAKDQVRNGLFLPTVINCLIGGSNGVHFYSSRYVRQYDTKNSSIRGL